LPEVRIKFALIRFAFVCPIVLIIFLLSFTKNFQRWWQFGALIATVVSGFGIILMTIEAPELARTSYYPGMMLVLFYCYMLIKLRFVWATLAGWIIFVVYLLSLLLFPGVDSDVMTINLFFVLSANILGMFSSYALEYYNRRDFFFRDLLSKESEKIALANRTLQERVNEQTKELQRDIQKRKQAEAEVEKYLTQLQALREIEQAITSTLEVDQILNIMMTELQRVVPHDSISAQMLRDHTLEIVACQGFSENDQVAGLIFPLDPKFPNQRVIETLGTLAIEDITRHYPHFEAESNIYCSGQIRSWMGSPLVAKDHVIGMITLNRSEVKPFSDEEIQLVETFTNQAAIALENARLFLETQRRLAQLNSLGNIEKAISGVLDLNMMLRILLGQIITQLEADAASMLLYDPQLHTLDFQVGQGFKTDVLRHTSLRLGEGYAGKAAQERRTIQMTDIDKKDTGFLVSPHFKQEGFKAYFGVPLAAKGRIMGVLEVFHRSDFHPDQEWLDFLDALAGQVAIAIDNINMFTGLQQAHQELDLAYDQTLEGWAHALEYRDMETEGHSRRVTDLTIRLARAFHITGKELLHIRRGALLHDIGKMGIPDRILSKSGPLDDDEWAIMHKHPVYAYDMLKEIEFLRPALDIPKYHHERWDGTGYPDGLKGEQIPLAARIFAVVDVWDALNSARPYRDAWPEQKVLAHIRDQSGKHFDPRVVEAFMKLVK
ncbi:MAG: GAF domain-containing protein, partial [Chloroflexota bacterium]|nr:GAF domain-containing protein [Chloroflexota bacterium]